MRNCLGFLVVGALAVSAVSAFAAKLPKDAVELTPDEVKQIYSGTTGVYKNSDQYFAPDGPTIGIFGKPKIKTVFKGTWAVDGNQMCDKKQPKGDSKFYSDCTKFWKSGDKLYGLWVVHYDGSKPDEKSGYYTHELKQHKLGDLVSKRYAAAGGV